MPAECELDWDEADTAMRVAVLKDRQDRAAEDHDDLKKDIAIVKDAFLPDGVIGKVASDMKTLKTIGWVLMGGIPGSVAVIGALLAGLLWLIRNTK